MIVKTLYAGSDSQFLACLRRYFAMVTMRSMAQGVSADLKAGTTGVV